MPAPYAIVDKQIKTILFLLTKCQVDKMSGWQNVRLTKCQVDNMSGWQNVRLTKWQGSFLVPLNWTSVRKREKIVVRMSSLENIEFLNFYIKLEGQKWRQDISLMTLSIMTLSLTTLSIMLGTIDLIVKLSKNNTQHKHWQ